HCSARPWVSKVGPTSSRPTRYGYRSGTEKPASSLRTIPTCSGVASRPPYAFGQEETASPEPASACKYAWPAARSSEPAPSTEVCPSARRGDNRAASSACTHARKSSIVNRVSQLVAQGRLAHLAARRAGKCRAHFQTLGQLEARQTAVEQVCAQGLEGGIRAGVRDHVRVHLLAHRAVGHRNARGLRDCGMRDQERLDLLGGDVFTATDDDVLQPVDD